MRTRSDEADIPPSALRALRSDSVVDRLILSQFARRAVETRQIASDAGRRWAMAFARRILIMLIRLPSLSGGARVPPKIDGWITAVTNGFVKHAFYQSSSVVEPDLFLSIRGSAEGRAVLTSTTLEDPDGAILLRLHRSEVLRPMVRKWLRENESGQASVADYIYEQLVTVGPVAVNAHDTENCLAAIPAVASILSYSRTVEIAQVVVALASAPTDPYSPTPTSASSRAALAELLAARPELDDSLIPEGSSWEAPAGRAYLKALAMALHRDLPRGARRFVAACARAGLARDEIVDLAAAASATRLWGALQERWSLLPAGRQWLTHTSGTIVSWVLPVAAVWPLLQFLVSRPPLLLGHVSLEVTVGIFALIATVHALIVTLSRGHLPRRMARITATPRILVSAYVTSMIGIIASSIDLNGELAAMDQSTTLAAAINAVSATATFFSVALLAISLFRVLRLSDPVIATGVFGRSSILLVGRAGVRFGRIQARSLELAAILEALPNVRMSSEAMPGEMVELIRARSRGLFAPANRDLLRLLSCPQVREGASLRVVASFGHVVVRLDPVWCVIPTSTQSVSSTTRRRATRASHLRGVGWLDRTRGVVASLYDLAVRLSREGDQGGAQRSASVCLDLAFRHLSTMADARREAYLRAKLRSRRLEGDSWRPGVATWQPPDPRTSRESPPSSPVIVDLVDSCVRSLSSDVSAERQVAMYVLRGLLAYGLREDRVPTLVTRALLITSRTGADPGSQRLDVLRRCAVRSLELDMPDQFRVAIEAMPRFRSESPDGLAEVAKALASAARIDSDAVENVIGQSLGDRGKDGVEVAGHFFHVGAAALDAGALRLAVKCVEELSALKFTSPTAEWLDLQSRLVGKGSYLGNTPLDALSRFGEFAGGIIPLLAGTPPIAPP